MDKKKPSGFVATLIGRGSREPDADDRGGPADFDEDDPVESGAHEMAYESLAGAVGDKQAAAIRDYVKACIGEGGSYGKE